MSVNKDLKDVVSELNKEFKETVATLLSEGALSDISGFIPTGVPILDILVRGGIPMGRALEIYGKPSSGKSTLITSIIVQCQKMGGVAVVIDSEGSWTKDRALSLGVDPGALLELGAKTVEAGFDQIDSTIRTVRSKPNLAECPVVIVWDTIANAPTVNEVDEKKTFKDKQSAWAGGISEKARVVRRGTRRLCNMMRDHNITLIFVNQVIEGPNGETTPGGWGVKHMSSLRIRLRSAGKIDSPQGTVGMTCEANVVKCKVSGPFPKEDKIQFPIYFDNGVDGDRAMLFYLADQKIDEVKYSGSWYRITLPSGESHNIQQAQFGQLLLDKPEIREWMVGLCKESLIQKPKKPLELVKTEPKVKTGK